MPVPIGVPLNGLASIRNVPIYKTAVVQSVSSVTMGTASAPQSEVDIPILGDLIGFIFVLTQSTTGTLTGANTIDFAVEVVNVKDRRGNPLMQSIRGQDLNEFEFHAGFWENGKGIATTVATSSSSAQTRRYFYPLRVSQAAMPARYQVTIAPYSAMATSGATGGSVSFECVAVYASAGAVGVVERDLRLTQAVVSGTNRFAPNLPKGRVIKNMAFTIGTESNLTKLTFSRDGSAELADMTPNRMQAMEQDLYNSGHQTGQFNVPLAPFISNENTILDIEAGGSDNLQWLIRISEPVSQ